MLEKTLTSLLFVYCVNMATCLPAKSLYARVVGKVPSEAVKGLRTALACKWISLHLFLCSPSPSLRKSTHALARTHTLLLTNSVPIDGCVLGLITDAGSSTARLRYNHTSACTYTHAAWPPESGWLLLRGLSNVPLLAACKSARGPPVVCHWPHFTHSPSSPPLL